jgi:hypothetical protein
MPRNIAHSRVLYSNLRAFRAEVTAMYQGAADRARSILLSHAPDGDTIDPRRLDRIRRQVKAPLSDILTAPYEDSPHDNGRAAYKNDYITPLSPYAAALNRYIALTQAQVVAAHYRFIRERLPDDVLRAMQRFPLPEEAVAEMGPADMFRANPLAQYDPAHLWVDPRGWRLSDRIWQADQSTRAAIDKMLAYEIRKGTGALKLSRMLEQFLVPGRASLRTKKPYGTDASYYAMRLARTEIARAHSTASKAAAYANPFVSGMDWALSHSHKLDPGDPCEEHATIWRDGRRVKDPYPVERAPVPVVDSHPHCICNIRPSVTDDVNSVVDDLRAALRVGQAGSPPGGVGRTTMTAPVIAPPNPSNPYNFLAGLLTLPMLRQAWGYLRDLFN